MTRQRDHSQTPKGADAIWRAEYRAQRRAERVASVQHDLFGGEPIELFHPTGKAKPRPDPKRYKRRAYLTPAEQTDLLASAANWLRIRQRVRIDADSPHQFAAREGVVWRLCSPVFADRVYVYLDAVGNERTEKIAFVEVRDVEPIGQ